ncbi:MAG TPA: glycosyltransferase [Bacteroidia bacterium]|nr:glycosyltransferase [Bacteroidia bacterium]
MFTNTFAPVVGGIETSVAAFAEDLAEAGHDLLVATLQEGDGDRDCPGVLRLPGLLGGESSFASTPNLFSKLDAFAPDLLHVHQPFLLGRAARRYAAARSLPLAYTHHTLYDRREDLPHLDALAGLEQSTRALAVRYSSLCDAVIAPTGSIAEILADQGIGHPIDIVPTGIDTAAFAGDDRAAFRQRHGIPADAFVVGHLGRLVPAKRIGFLAEAIAAFLTTHPDAHALVCGEGECAASLRSLFDSSGLADRLVLLGHLPPPQLADAYAAMDLFTFASLTDTQGIVLLEAMAAGVPVLALHATGPQDLVIHGETGWLLDPASSSAVFAQAIAAATSPDARHAASVAARRHAASFHRRLCAERLHSIYRRIADPPAAPRPDPTGLDDTFDRVESEWRSLAAAGEALRSLLPSRGFPIPFGFV